MKYNKTNHATRVPLTSTPVALAEQGACVAEATTVLCVDLRNETACLRCETCTAAQTILQTMCHALDLVRGWNGTLLSYTGQCLLATWSVAVDVESYTDSVDSAVQCAEQIMLTLIAPMQTEGLCGSVVVHRGRCVRSAISLGGSDHGSAETHSVLVGNVLHETVSVALRYSMPCVLVSETIRSALVGSPYIFLPLGLTSDSDVNGNARAAQSSPHSPVLYALCTDASSLSSAAFVSAYNAVIDEFSHDVDARPRRAMRVVREHAITALQKSLLSHLERLVGQPVADSVSETAAQGSRSSLAAAGTNELAALSSADSLSSRAGQNERSGDELTSFQRELHAKVRDLTASCTEPASLATQSLAGAKTTASAVAPDLDSALGGDGLIAGAQPSPAEVDTHSAEQDCAASDVGSAGKPACAQQLPLHRTSSEEQLAGRAAGDLSFAHSSALSGLEANSASHLSYLCQPLHCSVTAVTTASSSALAHHTAGTSGGSTHDSKATANAAGRTTSTRQCPTLPAEVRGKNGVCYLRSDRLLGKGSYGEVYLGMESDRGRLVAIKYLPIPIDEKELSGIESEVMVMQRVKDVHIVEFITYAFQEDKIVFVLECMMAGSLQRLIAEFHTIPRVTARVFLRDILQGLARLHGMDVIHRDVKPQNVLLTLSGTCKLSDFGTSALIPQLARKENEGHVMGTPVYLAPEAARGKPVKASDVWSCGIVFLQAVTGKLPYTVEQLRLPAALLVFQIGSGGAVPCVPETLDTQEATFVTSCLHSDPARRKTADELLHLPLFTF